MGVYGAGMLCFISGHFSWRDTAKKTRRLARGTCAMRCHDALKLIDQK
jgi:hypothetical protein